jgi:diaminopimelate decarboxylase
MNDLVRPAMYDAHHEFWPLTEPRAGAPRIPYEIVGPICESSDQFASGRPLPETAPGDLLAVMSAGAYGAAMASTYNQRRLPAEVLVDGDRFAVTRPRQTYDDLLGGDRMPDWLAPPARLSPAA